MPIDITKIKTADARIIGYGWHDMLDKFYSNPDNERKFCEWLKEIKTNNITNIQTIYGAFKI